MFSSLNIIFSVFNYIENFPNERNSFNLNNRENKDTNVLEEILKRHNDIINRFYDCLHAFNMYDK